MNYFSIVVIEFNNVLTSRAEAGPFPLFPSCTGQQSLLLLLDLQEGGLAHEGPTAGPASKLLYELVYSVQDAPRDGDGRVFTFRGQGYYNFDRVFSMMARKKRKSGLSGPVEFSICRRLCRSSIVSVLRSMIIIR